MKLKDLMRKLIGSRIDQPKRQRVDRAPRVRINTLHEIEFIAQEPRFSKPLKIENISHSGVGLIAPLDANHAELEVIVGKIVFSQGSAHPLKLRVVRFNGDHVGAVIEGATPAFAMALQKYFESEIAALRLKATRADLLKAVPFGTPHWFQGSNNCDLAYVSSGNDVIEFAISVFGNHIEGGTQRPLRYSEISEKKASESPSYKASDFLNQKNAPDTAMLILSQRVVRAVEGLPPDHRDSILKFLV
jgi:hypothetical protein